MHCRHRSHRHDEKDKNVGIGYGDCDENDEMGRTSHHQQERRSLLAPHTHTIEQLAFQPRRNSQLERGSTLSYFLVFCWWVFKREKREIVDEKLSLIKRTVVVVVGIEGNLAEPSRLNRDCGSNACRIDCKVHIQLAQVECLCYTDS